MPYFFADDKEKCFYFVTEKFSGTLEEYMLTNKRPDRLKNANMII